LDVERGKPVTRLGSGIRAHRVIHDGVVVDGLRQTHIRASLIAGRVAVENTRMLVFEAENMAELM
jgi:hypothetical protein